MENFYETVLTVLKADDRFFAQDGTFLRNAVYEAAMQMDTKLIRLLLKNDETKNRFFTDVDGVLVFDKVEFGWVVNNRQFLPDSYTRFKNKIGLADENGALISDSGKVALVFPYKDCILEGGQTKEDQKRSEVFYNESLAPDEVDRLLYPKVLTGAKRYTADGIAENVTFDDNENLIIKGNNLLAISSVLKRYEGRVKCIYIDPPYNTGADGFNYNDSFNHSSWLERVVLIALLSTNPLFLVVISPRNSLNLREQVNGKTPENRCISVNKSTVILSKFSFFFVWLLVIGQG
ncbi:MAG: site-specific DNA-methyltransferase [Candidatus Fimivivens sp.]